jgi:hypothetical protein
MIYEQYEEQFWYWEVVELVRKLMLTSIIIFFWPDSAMQLGAGLLMSLFFIVLYSSCRPYDSRGDDTLQLTCQIVIFFSYFSGLMLMVEVPQSEEPLFNTFVIGVAISPLITAGFMVVFCAIIPMVSAAMTALVKRKLTKHFNADADNEEGAHGKYASIRQRKTVAAAGASLRRSLREGQEAKSPITASRKMVI